MEVFFVYGLVLVFFIALPVLIFVLMKEPARESDASESSSSSDTSSSSPVTTSNIVSYGLLAAIFVLLFIVSVISQRNRA